MVTAAQSPWQNHYAERLIGSIRRECLDHLIVLGEGQLRRILREYFDYYNGVRPHQSLEKNSPPPRQIELPTKGRVISIPQVGGLHHRYRRAAETDREAAGALSNSKGAVVSPIGAASCVRMSGEAVQSEFTLLDNSRLTLRKTALSCQIEFSVGTTRTFEQSSLGD